MHYLWEAIIGLVVGAIAKFLMPGKDPGGIVVTMLLGIAGSFLATWDRGSPWTLHRRRIRRLHHVGNWSGCHPGYLPLYSW